MMNRRKIQEGYDQMAPTHEQKDRMLESILTAASARQPAGKDVPMKQNKRKTLMAALIAAMMLLLVGCGAAVVMKLNDLRIGEKTITQDAYFNAQGELVQAQEITKDLISLQGIAGSANYLAAQEWLNFLENCDDAGNEDFQAPRAYDAYSVHSQVMMDKVDEIAEKYGLKLEGQKEFAHEWQMDAFHEALGIDSPLKENAKVELTWEESPMKEQGLDGYYLSAGTIYECGNFEWGFLCHMTDPQSQWEWPVNPVLRYHDKDYLAVDSYSIQNAESAQQWIYETEDGFQVLIVNDGDFVYMFCDREDAFLTVQMNNRYYEDGNRKEMPQQDIERMADSIDFSMKPKKPDMAATVKALNALEQKYDAMLAAWEASFGDPFHKESYGELAESLNMKSYAVMDLNGDGIEEILLKGDYDNYALYTMKNGQTENLLDGGAVLYPCENSVMESYEVVGEEYYLIHSYYKMEGEGMILLDRIVFDRANERWFRSNDGIRAEEVITKEEAEKIISAYVRVDAEMKPVSELQK